MSGKKISEMTAITGAQLDQTTDVVPVLDVSDTANPNKKISIQELASALGGTTNASLVLDGSNNLILTDSDGNNVTADLSSFLDDTNTTNASLSLATNTLTLTDSASNSVDVDLSSLDNSGLTLADVTANGGVTSGVNIGIGTATALDLLHVSGGAVRLDNLRQLRWGGDKTGFYGHNTQGLDFYSSGVTRFKIANDGNIGINQTTPTVTLDINGTDAVQLTAGTELERPTTPANGMVRYNSDDDVFEGYAGGAWVNTSGLTLADVTANGAVTTKNIIINTSSTAGQLTIQKSGTSLLASSGSASVGAIQYYASNTVKYTVGINNSANSDFVISSGSAAGSNNLFKVNTEFAEFAGTSHIQLTSGTELQRPTTPANGMIRYNSDDDVFEGYAGGAWGEVPNFKTSGIDTYIQSPNGTGYIAWTTADTNIRLYSTFKTEILSPAGVQATKGTFTGTDAVQLTSGTTAEQPGQTGQPTAAAGMIRFNTTTSKFEGYDGTSWTDLN
jgi:hypothetical protein